MLKTVNNNNRNIHHTTLKGKSIVRWSDNVCNTRQQLYTMHSRSPEYNYLSKHTFISRQRMCKIKDFRISWMEIFYSEAYIPFKFT